MVPALAIEILPVGLTGLALAGILSVIMSTADSYLIVSVQTCVHDIYKTFKPDTPEKKELMLTRVFAVVLPLGALIIALYIKNPYNILMFAWSFYALPFGIGATVPGAIACGLALVLVSLATYKKAPTPFLNPYAKQKAE